MYGYDPTTVNVRESELTPLMLPPAGLAPVNVTLWPPSPFHVTVPGAEMSTVLGENGNPGEALADDGKALVTAIVWNDDAVALPSVASAVIFALPTATPVTRPVPAFTVATPVAFELHPIVAPAMALLFWSRGDALSCTAAPTATLVPPEMTTEVRARVVRPRLPDTDTPAAVASAVIVTAPPATPVTRPVPLTVARPAFDVDHAIVDAMAAPFWSRAAAVS